MRKLMKLIAITAMTALLFSALITCAAADEKIYTSPTFTLPADRLIQAEEILDAQEAANQPEEPEETGEEVPEDGEALSEDGEALPGDGEELPEEGEALPEDGEEISEDGEESDEPEEDEDFEELDETAGEVTAEPAKPKHKVVIRSSQGEIVTEGEQIVLTSELIGFDDDEQVTYQWQVDRGDGNGWVDAEGGTKWKYIFIADKTTITYSWRLIVNVIE